VSPNFKDSLFSFAEELRGDQSSCRGVWRGRERVVSEVARQQQLKKDNLYISDQQYKKE
jgi:hypothetical protein